MAKLKNFPAFDGWNGNITSLLLITRTSFESQFEALVRGLYVTWDVRDEMMGEEVLDFRASDENDTPVPDGEYLVRHEYCGRAGWSTAKAKVVNGQFDIGTTMRACAEARDASNYPNGFYIEWIVFDRENGHFDVSLGS